MIKDSSKSEDIEKREDESSRMERNGKLIVFEGIDGSGKSTQIQLLKEKLMGKNISCYLTMEPTDSPIGSIIHQIMTGRMKAEAKVIAALFAADRLDHLLNEVDGICHKIEEGTVVLMDRYYFSSYAYQSTDTPMEWLMQINGQSSAILQPDINIFIDIEPDEAMERINRNRFQKELYEERSKLVQVRKKYMEAFDKLKDVERVVIINGSRSRDEIAADVWNVVEDIL